MVTKSNGAKGKEFCPNGYVKKCYDDEVFVLAALICYFSQMCEKALTLQDYI